MDNFMNCLGEVGGAPDLSNVSMLSMYIAFNKPTPVMYSYKNSANIPVSVSGTATSFTVTFRKDCKVYFYYNTYDGWLNMGGSIVMSVGNEYSVKSGQYITGSCTKSQSLSTFLLYE